MIIDFHTHIFPDALASRAKNALVTSINELYKPVTDMTLSSLLTYMEECHVDLSVVQPVLTKASQLKSTNEFAASITGKKIISFGGIYPHTDDYKRDIDYVVSLGLKGLKFHAEYQKFTVDSPEMLRIYDYAFEKGLLILQHAGADPAFDAPYHTSPKQFANIVKTLPGGIMIAAHFGGHAMWDEVEEVLAGTDIYLDTSMGFQYYSMEQFLRIVKKHGADKILFASDSPWSNTKQEIETLKNAPLSDVEKAMIFSENAKRLLSLS